MRTHHRAQLGGQRGASRRSSTARALHLVMANLDVTDAELAERLETSRQTVNSRRKGRVPMTAEDLAEVADALGVDVATGESVSHEQLRAMTRPAAPPSPMVPPAPVAIAQRKPLNRRQRTISIAAVAAFAILIGGYGAGRSAGWIEPPPTTRRADPFTDAAEIYQTAQPRQVESCCAALVVVLGRPGEPILDGQVTAFGRLLGRLGMPAGTAARMDGTRALDGTQSAEGDHATATWTYHPDNGLRVVFQPK